MSLRSIEAGLLGTKLCNVIFFQNAAHFHNTVALSAWHGQHKSPTKWLDYNKEIYPPQTRDEEPRPAVIRLKSDVFFLIKWLIFPVCLPPTYQHKIQSV